MVARIGGFAVLAVMVVAVTSAMAALQDTPGGADVANGTGEPGAQEGYALTPRQNAVLIVECLEDRGVEAVRNGTGIRPAQNPATSSPAPGEAAQRPGGDQRAFDEALHSCQTALENSGYLLPRDNPTYLTKLYSQFTELARCYRSEGIEVSDPPDMADFITARQDGGDGWSPQNEAERIAGVEATRRAEENCDLPEPPS